MVQVPLLKSTQHMGINEFFIPVKEVTKKEHLDDQNQAYQLLVQDVICGQ